MLVSDFDFILPVEKIALEPATPRDSSKLLQITNNQLIDKNFSDLPSLLKEGDLLVFNDTKVINARFLLKQDTRTIEATLHKQLSADTWLAFVKPARKLHVGEKAFISDDFFVEVLDKNFGEVTLKFNESGSKFFEKLEQYGFMPLPPYIKRDKGGKKSDEQNYQTIFAKNEGAVAAPTASLHFTPELLQKLTAKNIKHSFVTLHVGAGTYLPVKVSDTKDHIMHYEYGVINKETALLINQTKKKGGRIIAVGTTVLRILETASNDIGDIKEFSGETNIFITPGYKFKIIDLLITNFHLPKSTLFMLVAAFSGLENMKKAYKHAIDNNYRFYSYGDACLLYKEKK